MKSILKVAAPTVTIVILSVNSAVAAISMNLENGSLCLNNYQCKSGVCLRLSSGISLNYCMPKNNEGEGCASQAVNNIYAKPACESGLICTKNVAPDFGAELPTNEGWCIDPSASCQTCNLWVHVGVSNAHTGYEEYLHGKCDSQCGQWEAAMRCADGYYGIAHSMVVTSPTGCQKCPENGKCYEGHNETFYCGSGYYKTATECIKCPAYAVDKYGQTELVFHQDGIESCYAPAGGPYTNTNGTFKYSSDCPYK